MKNLLDAVLSNLRFFASLRMTGTAQNNSFRSVTLNGVKGLRVAGKTAPKVGCRYER